MAVLLRARHLKLMKMLVEICQAVSDEMLLPVPRLVEPPEWFKVALGGRKGNGNSAEQPNDLVAQPVFK